MKTIFVLCGLTLIVGLYFGWRALQVPPHFGEFAGAVTVEVADLIERPKDFQGKLVAIEGTISEQCKSMGCFFFIQAGAKTLRVDLQEIAMTAPMREGHQARIEGQMVPFQEGFQLFASAIEFK